MSPKFHKYKLLLDEGLPPRTSFPQTNARHDVKHIREDFKLGGLEDDKVYKKAVMESRLLVVFNVKDFKQFAEKSLKSGIIGISQTLSKEQIDKKLTAHLVKHNKGDLYGKYTFISGETGSVE